MALSGDCVQAVRAKIGGVFSEAEIEDLLARVANRAIKASKEAPGLAQREAISSAGRALTDDEILKGLLAKRNEMSAKAAYDLGTREMTAMGPDLKGWERLTSWLVGRENQVHGGSFSTDSDVVARIAELVGIMRGGLLAEGQYHRLVNFFGLPEQGFPRLVAREIARLNGNGEVEPTGDDGAVRAARVIVQAQRAGVKMQNDVGAWIGDLTGYVARQSHNAEKIAGGYFRELGQMKAALKKGEVINWDTAERMAQRRSFSTWRDFIMPLLHEKTFEGLDERDFDARKAAELKANGIIKDAADPRELMMYTIWWDIQTGRHSATTGSDNMAEFRPSNSTAQLAKAVSRERILHFASPDAWMDYNDRYGNGGLFKTIHEQLLSAGRNSALMKRFGPNPEHGFQLQQERLAAEALLRGDTGDEGKIWGGTVKAQFENVNGRGSEPTSMRLAQTMRSIRTIEVLTKLGGIVLSKFPDLPIAGFTMQRVGGKFLQGMGGDLTGFLRLGSADAKRAADGMDVASRAFGSEMAGQHYTTDGAAGWGSWLSGVMLRINAFEGVNNSFRRGFAQVYSRVLAQEAEHGWAGLQQGTRETLERFGLGADDWEALRQGLETQSDGRTYFTLDHTERLADEAAARAGLDPAPGASGYAGPEGTIKAGETPTAEALAEAQAAAERHRKISAMVHNVIDDTVSHPRARETSALLQGYKPGTYIGELLRALTQFKGFVTTILGRQFLPMTRGGYAGIHPAILLSQFFVANLVAGYLGMSAKQIARGEAPRNPFGPDLGQDAKVWLGSLAQAGGLGIYGDFLFGQEDRQGTDLIGALGGPMVGDAEAILKVVKQALTGGAISPTTGRSQIPGELVRLGGHLVPFANLFYTRLAFDYFVLWRMQEAASPGFLQRYENRVQKQEGASFILPPTTPSPYH